MFDTIRTKVTRGETNSEDAKTASRRRVLRGTAAGVAAISTIRAGTGMATATRRYQVRRVRTETPGQQVIEDVALIHDRRLFGEDVFYVAVTLTDYAMRYDRQRVVVSAAEDWAWDGPVMDRSTGEDRTRRLLSNVEVPVLQTPRAMDPLAVKVWTETDPGRGDWLSQERTIVEPSGTGSVV